MPPAARVGDMTGHPGVITGPGVPTVLIGGMPAAVVGDLHTCSFPPPAVAPADTDHPAGLPDGADRRPARRPGRRHVRLRRADPAARLPDRADRRLSMGQEFVGAGLGLPAAHRRDRRASRWSPASARSRRASG